MTESAAVTGVGVGVWERHTRQTGSTVSRTRRARREGDEAFRTERRQRIGARREGDGVERGLCCAVPAQRRQQIGQRRQQIGARREGNGLERGLCCAGCAVRAGPAWRFGPSRSIAHGGWVGAVRLRRARWPCRLLLRGFGRPRRRRQRSRGALGRAGVRAAAAALRARTSVVALTFLSG